MDKNWSSNWIHK